jgi:hypothetical protein
VKERPDEYNPRSLAYPELKKYAYYHEYIWNIQKDGLVSEVIQKCISLPTGPQLTLSAAGTV